MKIKINLRMFDEGVSSQPANDEETFTDNKQGRIEYGIDLENVDNSNPTNETVGEENVKDGVNTEENLEETFGEMIKGKYKDAFSKATQKIINKRFSENRTLKENLNKANEVVSAIATKYGLDASDSDSIIKAISDDDAYLREKADEAGIPFETYKRMQMLETQNANYIRQQQQAQAQAQVEATVLRWQTEAESFKEIVPGFSLEEEIQSNEQFAQLLQAGVGVKPAYMACHSDEMLGSAMQVTARKVAEKIAKGRDTNLQRPSENAMNSQGGIVRKTNVNDLTAHDRAEIARRVAMGEKISF